MSLPYTLYVIGFTAVAIEALVIVWLLFTRVRRRTVQAERQQNDERDRAILSAIPDLMFLHSPDGTFLDYHATNPGALLMAPELFLGKNIADVMPQPVAADLLNHFRQ